MPMLPEMLRSPHVPVAAGIRFWRHDGARIRRARVLCQSANGLRLRRPRDWEARSTRLYRRAANTLSALTPMKRGTSDWATTAHQMLVQARRPYRRLAAGLLILACELAAATALLVALACAVSSNLRHRLFPEDLAAGKPWTVTDSEPDMPSRGNGPSTDGSHFFHTRHVDSPFVEIDLGAMHTLRSVRIDNRADCCQERTLPLNVEIFDGTRWQLIAQRRAAFSVWRYDVDPVRARLVRVRRPGANFFHLKRISIYGQ